MKKLTIIYAAIQFFYTFAFGAVNNYSSVYLLPCGLTNTEIGVLFAVSCALAIWLQPAVGSYADRKDSFSIKTIICFLACLSVFFSACLHFAFGKGAVINSAVFFILIIISQIQTPLVSALATETINQGKKLAFGVARGCGSLGYSAMSVTMGAVIAEYGAGVQPAFVFAGSMCFLVFALIFPFKKRRIEDCDSIDKEEEGEYLSCNDPDRVRKIGGQLSLLAFFSKYKRLSFALLGLVFLYICHIYINNFTYQIVLAKGGTSAEMGNAMALASALEIITMFSFPLLTRWKSVRFFFKISGFFFILKSLLTLLVKSMGAFYWVQFIQPFGWGLLAVSSVYYVNSIVDDFDKIKGQAYLTLSFTIANVLGALSGGLLLDYFGVNGMLLASIASGVLGFIMVLKSA